jgi:chaperone BCS1
MKKFVIAGAILSIIIILIALVGIFLVNSGILGTGIAADGITWLYGQFGTNDFLVGTTVPFIIGGAIYIARSWISVLYSYFIRNFTVGIRINSTTENFEEINEYMFNNFVWGIFRRNFVLSHMFNSSQLIMTAGYGRSIALVHGCLGFIELTAEESDSYAFKEYLELKVLTLRPNRTSRIIFDEIIAHIKLIKTKNTVDIYKTIQGDRCRVASKPKRSLDTIFISNDIKQRIMTGLTKFQESEKSYIEKGLPWHLGIILHGPPGTGKTSLIHAIASEIGYDIYYHTTGTLTNTEFDPKKTILVLEDFDTANFETMIVSKNSKSTKKVSSSSLADTLNFLDGFLTPHGLIVIATTNHLDKLDPTVIRPGRFDIIEKIPLMDLEQYLMMCAFYEIEPAIDKFEPGTGAKLMADIKSKWQSVDTATKKDEDKNKGKEEDESENNNQRFTTA